MERRKLASKLDAIEKSELGVPFDEQVIWDQIATGIGVERQRTLEKRFLLAACLTILVLFLPLDSIKNGEGFETKVLAQTATIDSSTGAEIVAEIQEIELPKTPQKLARIQLLSKGVDLGVMDLPVFENPILKPIEIKKPATEVPTYFAASDIEAIQATLRKSDKKNKLKISVKMEVYTSLSSQEYSETELKLRINGRN